MAQVSSIADEIAEFMNHYIQNAEDLPQVINLAFSGERKPEAWHVRTTNRQVGRGFNKSASVTVMLPLKSWRKLIKKKDAQLWRKALEEGQIHMHGDEQAIQLISNLFQPNGKHTSKNGKTE